MRFVSTVVLGALFAVVTALIVLLYWLMIVLFRALYLLTLPLHVLWRAIRT